MTATANPFPAPCEPATAVEMVTPKYPPFARSYRIQGTVTLSAVVTADGQVTNLSAVRGPSVLAGAALAAVSQWSYRPARINGVAVDSPVVVRVRFELK